MLEKIRTSFENDASLNDGLRPPKTESKSSSTLTPIGADKVEEDLNEIKSDLASTKAEIEILRNEIDQSIGNSYQISIKDFPIIKAAYYRVFGVTSDFMTYSDYRYLLSKRAEYERSKSETYLGIKNV